MYDPRLLTTLATVLRTGTLERAATELGITPPAVSQRLRSLEERAGAQLVRRGPPARGTAMGLRLARHADDLAMLDQQLVRDLTPDLTPGAVPLRLAVNADSLATWALPALAEVPDLLFDLIIDDQDHSADWLRRGEVAGAITAHVPALPGCRATPLGALDYVAVCSPAFYARYFAAGLTPETLAQAPMMRFDRKDRLQDRWLEAATGQGDLRPPAHALPSSTAFVEAAQLGLGWGMNPVALVEGPLAEGALVELRVGVRIATPLVWQVPRSLASALKPLTASLRRHARAKLASL